jgi:prolyl oligopeptidase
MNSIPRPQQENPMRSYLFSLALQAALALSILLPVTLPAADVPTTDVVAVTDSYHGTEVVDPYRWLEGSDAPEVDDDAKLDARVGAWTDAQNALTRATLDGLPGRDDLEARLRELLEISAAARPEVRGERYFTWRRAGSQAQWTIQVQEGLHGEPRVILDPNALDETGLTAVGWIEPSPDGSSMAFGLYQAGDEMAVLHLLDVASGEWLADEIPNRVRGVSWMPDGKSFVYHRLEEVEDPYSTQILFHRVGTHHRQDRLIFEQYDEGPLATTWGPGASVSRDGRWLMLQYWTGTDSLDLWVADFGLWRRTGELILKDVVVGEKAISNGPVVGDTLFLQTTFDAPNGRVVVVDLHHPERERWREIIPERDDAVIDDVRAARGILAVQYLRDASSRIERFDFDGRSLGEIELPGIGSTALYTEPDRTEAFFAFESFNRPDSLYRVDLASGESELWIRPEVPVDPSLVEVRQVFYDSKDGTRVPMFLVHRQGLERDGDNPVMLAGYGGFNVSETPAFRATRFPWFEAGGVYALANLRGGGEYGEAWHRAGMLANKQNVFDDFIAAAEWLIENDYTRPERLAILGGSNGGLLTGAALVQRPELFGAVVSAVPLLDMLRYQHFLMARYWVPEYGSAEDPEQFAFLHAYSPYHQVKAGVAYPATFLTAGENDARVHALHARKMAARLQAATASDPAAEPILLWVDRDAGHGRGKPLDLRVRDAADLQMFLRWQLGMIGD